MSIRPSFTSLTASTNIPISISFLSKDCTLKEYLVVLKYTNTCSAVAFNFQCSPTSNLCRTSDPFLISFNSKKFRLRAPT